MRNPQNLVRSVVLSMVGAAFLAFAPNADAGCFTLGYGGSVVDSTCEYVEDREGANVYMTIEGTWYVSANRQCPKFTTECAEDAVGCTAPCTAAYEADRCAPAATNQCAAAVDAAGAPVTFERQIDLGSGEGTPTTQPIRVATRPGDRVIVLLDRTTAGQGPWGFIAVGTDDDAVEGKLVPAP